MKTIIIILVAYLVIINIGAFILYGADKRKARRGKWRVSEATLIWIAILGGSLGAYLGMKYWHHKTQHKKFRYGLPAILIIQVLLPPALIIGASCYLIGYSLRPGGKEATDAQILQMLRTDHPGTLDWAYDLQRKGVLRDTFIVNDRGLRLHALYAHHPEAQGTAVLVHGYTDTAWSMMMFGKLYYDTLHYNILLPEHQRHGESEGDAIQMGWLDRLNIERWIDIADSLWSGTPIYLHGVSMGGATVMMCSGDALPSSVKGIIDDCGFTSVWDEFSGEIANQFGLPVHPLLDVASFICNLRYGWNFKEASALEQVRKSTLPMLFIHGGADDYVPTAMVHPLYEAKTQGYKQLWIAPGSAHAVSYRDHREEYKVQLLEFLKHTK